MIQTNDGLKLFFAVGKIVNAIIVLMSDQLAIVELAESSNIVRYSE
jgi:hypothetical protein